MPLQTLLVIAERAGETQAALQRAAVIARHAGAKIELFSCDTEHAWALGDYANSREARAVIDQCMAESRRFLEAVRSSISALDVHIETRCACASALHEGIGARIATLAPQLVLKSMQGSCQRRTPQPLEMQLVQACRTPLLLTRGAPWRPAPRIGAALDLAEPALIRARAVQHFAATFAAACAGSLRQAFVGTSASATKLRQLGLAAEAVTCLPGSPREALRHWVEAQRLDVLVLGAAERFQARRLSLTEQLLSELPCDILVVPARSATALTPL